MHDRRAFFFTKSFTRSNSPCRTHPIIFIAYWYYPVNLPYSVNFTWSILARSSHLVNFILSLHSVKLYLRTPQGRMEKGWMEGREGGYKQGQERRTDNCLGNTLFPTAYLMRLQMSLRGDSCWRIRKEFPQLLGVQVHQGRTYQPQLQQRDSKGEK